MTKPHSKEPGLFFKIAWAALVLQILIVPALFAAGALESGGTEIVLGIIAATLIAVMFSLRGTDWRGEHPIIWLGLIGGMAQMIAGPFLSVRFEDMPFPRSLVPALENPLATWVVIVGNFGAIAVAAVVLRYRERLLERLTDIPLEYRATAGHAAAAALGLVIIEVVAAFLLLMGLHPPLWNTMRWIALPVLYAALFLTAITWAAFRWKEWRDEEFEAFWKNFDVSSARGGTPKRL